MGQCLHSESNVCYTVCRKILQFLTLIKKARRGVLKYISPGRFVLVRTHTSFISIIILRADIDSLTTSHYISRWSVSHRSARAPDSSWWRFLLEARAFHITRVKGEGSSLLGFAVRSETTEFCADKSSGALGSSVLLHYCLPLTHFSCQPTASLY